MERSFIIKSNTLGFVRKIKPSETRMDNLLFIVAYIWHNTCVSLESHFLCYWESNILIYHDNKITARPQMRDINKLSIPLSLHRSCDLGGGIVTLRTADKGFWIEVTFNRQTIEKIMSHYLIVYQLYTVSRMSSSRGPRL